MGKKNSVENGVLGGNEFKDVEYFKNEKIDKVIDYSYEFPKMVVFAKYRGQIDLLTASLEAINKKTFVLTGDTIDRGSLLEEAKKCDDFVFICQSSIASGWELPDVPVVIFMSLDWSVSSYIQGIGRIQRIHNLKKNLYIHLIVKGGVDERIFKSIVHDKMDFHVQIYE
jgi:superfamily II DNA/RNA helicase